MDSPQSTQRDTSGTAGGVPVPPTGACRPRSGASRAWHVAKWLLAMAAVFAVYLLIAIATTVYGGSAVGVSVALASGDYEAFLNSGAFDDIILMFSVASQLVIIAVFWPWWRHMREGSFIERRVDGAAKGVSLARSFAVLMVIGIAAQFLVSGLLTFVELFFPESMAEYAELMEDSSVGVFAVVSAVSIAVLAPINEEIVCRGVMLEYAMRAVSPGWDARGRARRLAVSERAFWIANALQALAFGVLHMNIIQGSYAFALGMLGGWVFWRTGKLRYPIMLHFALNASSYLVEPLAPMVNALPTPLVVVVSAALFAGGIGMFARLWHSSDALPAVELPPEAVSEFAPAEGSGRPTPPEGFVAPRAPLPARDGDSRGLV